MNLDFNAIGELEVEEGSVAQAVDLRLAILAKDLKTNPSQKPRTLTITIKATPYYDGMNAFAGTDISAAVDYAPPKPIEPTRGDGQRASVHDGKIILREDRDLVDEMNAEPTPGKSRLNDDNYDAGSDAPEPLLYYYNAPEGKKVIGVQGMGNKFSTYYNLNDSLSRVKSSHLPMRDTFTEAQNDLDNWAADKNLELADEWVDEE